MHLRSGGLRAGTVGGGGGSRRTRRAGLLDVAVDAAAVGTGVDELVARVDRLAGLVLQLGGAKARESCQPEDVIQAAIENLQCSVGGEVDQPSDAVTSQRGPLLHLYLDLLTP